MSGTTVFVSAEARSIFDGWLKTFAHGGGAEDALRFAFGTDIAAERLQSLQEAWRSGTYALPRIELIDAAAINGANGAYAGALDTIYLAEQFVTSEPADAVARLLLEEYGHAVDHALNGGKDATGDEGALFARLVSGPPVSDGELAAMKVEDDTTVVQIAGAATLIEQADPVRVTFASNRHVFSINDILGGFNGLTYAQDPTIIAIGGTPDIPALVDKNGDVLSPIDSEFGFYVEDFVGAEEKVRDDDYAEGWAGNILDDGGQVVGIATVNAVTDTFKSGQPFGTWAAGLGGNSVKASTEHYEVMAYLLSDQEFVGDVTADYALDNNLKVRGTFTIGGIDVTDPLVTDLLAEVGDVNGDGVEDIKDVLLPNESTTAENIAYGDDYSVTLKDDGKLLYRWGTEVKRPNDIRMDVKLSLPDEWQNTADLNGNATPDVFEINGGLGYRVTRAELVIAHDVTNNPNDQIRPEDYENEAATGRGPSYFVVTDPEDATNTLWVSVVDSYAGSGEFLPSYFRMTGTGEIDLVAQPGDVAVYHPDGALAGYRNADADGIQIGTVYRDLSRIALTDSANLVFTSSDLEGGFTNAWYTTTDREPFEWSYDKFVGTDGANEFKQVFVGFRSAEDAAAAGYTEAELVSGPRWRLTSNKFGQDVPGVEIPLIDNSQPPYQKGNIKYEVGEPIVTVINLLDWADDNGDGIENDSPLLFSAGWTFIDPMRLDLDLDGLIDEGWLDVNGTFDAGDTMPTGPIFSAVTPNGLTLTPDFLDTAVYLKGDRQDSAKIYNIQLVLEFEADPDFAPGYDYEAASAGDAIFTVNPTDIIPDLGSGSGGGGQPSPPDPDIDEPLNTTPTYRVTHVFSTADVTGTFAGLTQGDVLPGETPVIDFTATPKVTKEGIELYPINSEFGFIVTDFDGAVEKDFILNPEYEEGWAGDLKAADGTQLGIVVSDSPTDTFKTPALLGTWLVGMGGDAVKADSEHYSVMQAILSDQRYPGDPDALYPLDDNLILIGGAYDGKYVADVLPIVGDANGDGAVDIRDVLLPNEATVTENIAVSNDYSVTLKDDGKLLYRWGNEIKKPNDIRIEAELPLPDEWKTPDAATPDLLPLFRVTQAELVVRHTLTNNPNDQIRPEDYENEAATGTLPEYQVLADGKWVTVDDYYAGDGTLYPAGTVLKDPAIALAAQGTLLDQIGALSEDLIEGYTNAWYTTMNREPFEPVLDPVSGEYEVGPRWRLKADKYGQDLPGVDIPKDPSLPPPPTQAEIKYEVGADTQTVINLLDWDGISPLTISAGWTNAAGTVSVNGLNLTENFDVAFYVKGDIKPATIYSAELLMSYEEVDIGALGAAVTGTAGDDVLAGLGGNIFTGLAGADLFVLSYGETVNSEVVASTVNDFEVGLDRLGLIGLEVNALNFATTVAQTVVGTDLQISLDGTLIATLIGVDEQLADDSFMVLTTQFDSGASMSITATDARRVEGDAGVAAYTFTVTRSGDTSVAHSVSWAVTGAGANGATATDFDGSVLPGGVVDFVAGETSKVITVKVAGDEAIETAEGFAVTLSGQSSGVLLGTASALGAILNDDHADRTDLNGDGRDDVVWQSAGDFDAIYTSASGGFGLAGIVGTPGEGYSFVGSAPVGGAAGADPIWARAGEGVIIGLGSADVPPGYALQAVSDPGAGWSFWQTADTNGDGRSELLWKNGEALAVTLLDGTAAKIADTWLGVPGANWEAVAVSDLNGDGRSDILWNSEALGGTASMLLAADGVTIDSINWLSKPGDGWTFAATGDFDADGRDDSVWELADGHIAVMLTADSGASSDGSYWFSKPGDGWALESVADVNADGRADTLWINDASGGAVAAFVTRETLSTDGTPNADGVWWGLPGDGWRYSGTGDVNGDDREDVVFEYLDGSASAMIADVSGATTGPSYIGTLGAGWNIIG